MSGALYCATFAGSADGWPTSTSGDSGVGYDSRDNNGYAIVANNADLQYALAPESAVKMPPDLSVQLDVDAAEAKGSDPSGQFGLLCWEHQQAASGVEPAVAFTSFGFMVSSQAADIMLWDARTGASHILASAPTDAVQPGSVVHLTAQCLQRADPTTGGTEAQLSLAINGSQVVSLTYADNPNQNYPWFASSGVGLAASGSQQAGETVYFANFAVTSKCQTDGSGDYTCP